MDRYDNFGAFEDEDYRAAGESSAPTEESGPEEEEKKSFDSDALVDEPEEIDQIGVKTDCVHEDGKITKEIVTMGEGKSKPQMGWLCRIKYIAYFYDKEIFDSSPKDGEGAIDICVGDIAYPEGLWRGLQYMRKNEKAKVRIQKKYAFGRPGEVEALRFPRGFSEEAKDAERRAKLTSKAVIYEVTLLDWVERMDMDGNTMLYKQTVTKASKKEFDLPNQDLDEVTLNMRLWQTV